MGNNHVSDESGAGRPLSRRVVIGAAVAGVAATAGLLRRNLEKSPSPSLPSLERRVGSAGPVGDDTSRLNMMFARGDDVWVPAGDYRVSVDDRGSCLVVDVPGTRVVFQPGVTISLHPTKLGGYVVLSVEARDCTVTGGTIVGDLVTHSGSEGEWGHGVAIVAGADRCVLRGVRAMQCWGDGFYVNGGVADVHIDTCEAEGNRRQGLSVVDAVRPRITGGSYRATGRLGSTAPASGIDLEPNPGGAVVGAVVEGVTLSGNKGQGLLVSARHGPVSATVTRCTSSENINAGYMFDGPGTQVVLQDSSSLGNSVGVTLSSESKGILASRVVASGNHASGFALDGHGNRLTACVASQNGASGFLVKSTAVGSVIESCSGSSNSMSRTVPDFDVAGPGTLLVSARSVAGVGTPSSAVVVRAGAQGAFVRGGSWTGPYAVATVQDLRPVQARPS